MRKFYVIFLVAFFAGCAGELSLEAQRIVIVGEKPSDCAFLGNESGQIIDTSGAMSDSGFKQSAEADLRTKSAKLGGNTLRILKAGKSWNDSWSGYEYTINAEVYKCVKDLGESNETNDSSNSDAKNTGDSTKDSPKSSESNADSAKDSSKSNQ